VKFRRTFPSKPKDFVILGTNLLENQNNVKKHSNYARGLMSASPGGLGGLRGLVHVRVILENIGVMVIPNQIAISKANDVFNLDGTMKDQKQEQQVRKIGDNLAQMLMKLN